MNGDTLLHIEAFICSVKKVSLYSFLFLGMFAHSQVHSQTDTVQTARNSVYLEVVGIGGYGSINYERLLVWNQRLQLRARIGLSTYHLRNYTDSFSPDFIVPIAVNGLYGKIHHAELGVGPTITNFSEVNEENWQIERNTQLHLNFTIGYRYQKKEGGLVLRCAYTPLLIFTDSYTHWGGGSIGYSF
jgi:hypothetical protein